jgi:hypothetical protein
MPVVATINFQIMEGGVITLSGAASGDIVGPYWNTITLVDPSLDFVVFTVTDPQPSGISFVTWGGAAISTGPNTASLSIQTDVSASYLAVAVFAENRSSLPPPCLNQSCKTTVTTAPPEPVHESIRIAGLFRRCCTQALSDIPVIPNCQCRQPQDFRTIHHRTERERILHEAVRYPLHFTNRDTGGLCATQHAAVHAPPQPSLLTGTTVHVPYAIRSRRPFHRIGGIEEICRPVRGVSGSELTARIRARTESSNTALRRHSEHFRTLPPPPARLCRPVRTEPQAGVPTAPVTPCILGNQRVDFSSPTK